MQTSLHASAAMLAHPDPTTSACRRCLRVAAPQVADRIGIARPDTGELVWIDAAAVGPTEPDPIMEMSLARG